VLILKKPKSQQDSVSIDSLLLKETQGATRKDKVVLFSLKNIYLASRVASMFIMGKKNGAFLYGEGEFSFKDFLYKSVKRLRMDNLQLKVSVPKYGFQAYCLGEDDFDNFVMMIQHEHDLIERFTPKDGDIVVDVNSRIDLYTMLSSKQVCENGKVIAITVDPQIFDTLNHNIKLNNLTNIIPFNYIAYSQEMEMVLVPYSRMLSGEDEKSITADKIKAVHVNTLDNLLRENGINKVNWIKIDVEGAELEVLKGAYNTVSNSKDVTLLIEIHGHNNYEPVIDLLTSLNMRVIFQKNFDWGDSLVVARH
jgi:FkbM family methyltransferase